MRALILLVFVLYTGIASAEQTQHGVQEGAIEPHKALCRIEFAKPEQQLKELQDASLAAPFANAGVGGLGIKNENAELIRAYRGLVSYKNYKFNYVTDIDLWGVFKNSKCDKALCAAQEIFGKERGTLFLYLNWKYGLNPSELGFNRLKPPTPSDQTQFDAYFSVKAWDVVSILPFLSALPLLPSIQVPFRSQWRLNRAGIVNPMNPEMLSNGIIQIYLPLEGETQEYKEQALFHEIGHIIGFSTGLDRSPKWFAASGWKLDAAKKAVNADPASFVSEYAKTDFFEDFAESFVYYRYAPELLLKKSPSRYAFFKENIFGNREYRSAADCL